MSELLPDEHLILKVHRHWVVLVRPLLLPVLLVAVAGAVDWLFRNRLSTNLLLIASLAAVALAGLVLSAAWISWTAHSFTLTNQRVILESGILSRSTKVIALDRIQDLSTRQSIGGRILGYGMVEIDAAGLSGSEVLDHLPRPNRFRDHVFSEAAALRRSQPLPAPGSIPGQ